MSRLTRHALPIVCFRIQNNQSSPRQILASAVRHDILEQYEQACLEAGFLPNSVGLSGLDVCDYFQPKMQSLNQRVKGKNEDGDQEYLFVYLTNWGFSFIAFHHNHPAFIRVKSLPLARVQFQHPTPDSTEGDSFTTPESRDDGQDSTGQMHEDYTPLQISHVSNELAATLQYYFESQQNYTRHASVPIPLYIAEGLWHGDRLLPTEETVETLLKTSTSYTPPLRISKVSDMLSSRLRRTILKSEPQMTSFAAFASAAVLS